MKVISSVVSALMLCVSTVALSQSAAREPQGPKPGTELSSGQPAFDRLKTLAGNWKGMGAMGPESAQVRVTLRVTAGGSAILQEMVPEGRSADPLNGDDDPITMLYIDGGRTILEMYCDGGKNRPRMVGTLSPDGKKVEFTFLDVAGGTKYGYMSHAVFTIIDADHHTEDWTYTTPDHKSGQGHIDLVRAK